MSDAPQPHILPDETLDYIADDVLSCNRPKDALLVAMKRVRAQYERVFYWNEARLFRRIAELEARLADSQPAAQPPRWEPVEGGFAREGLTNWYLHATDYHITIGSADGGYTYFLPDDLRLCRFVQQQPQENSSHE